MRQRRESAAGAQRRARARGRHANGPRRGTRAAGAPDAHRKPASLRPSAASAGLGVAAWCHRGLLALVGDRIPGAAARSGRARSAGRRVHHGRSRWPPASSSVSFPHSSRRATRGDALREGGRHGGGRRLHRVLGTLVVAEVALSLVLLAGAGLLMRSFVKLQSNDLGFRAEGVLTAGVQLPATRYDVAEGRRAFSAKRCRASRRCRASSTRRALRACRCRLPASARASGASIAQAGGRSADIRPDPADHAGVLQDDGDSAGGRTRFLRRPTRWTRCPSRSSARSSCRQQFADGDPLGRRLRVNFNHANGKGRHGMDGRRRRRQHQVVARRARPPDDLRAGTQRPGGGMHVLRTHAAGPGVARGQRDGRRSRDGSGSAGRSPARSRKSSATRSRGRARFRCWSACSRSWRWRSRRSASTA